MRHSLQRLLFAVLLLALVTGAARRNRVETVELGEERGVQVVVPSGFSFDRITSELGLISVKLEHPARQILMTLTFIPDPDSRLREARERTQLMFESFNHFVADSVEKGMQFEELKPRFGEGTYCVFTDASLVGKSDYPSGEYLHVTAGIKAWPGTAVLFTIFSNETQSSEYRSAMAVLRDSVRDKLSPQK